MKKKSRKKSRKKCGFVIDFLAVRCLPVMPVRDLLPTLCLCTAPPAPTAWHPGDALQAAQAGAASVAMATPKKDQRVFFLLHSFAEKPYFQFQMTL